MAKKRTSRLPSVPEALVETGAAPLPDQRRERFSLGIVSGLTLTDAYMQAGYRTKDRLQARKKASELAQRPEVSQRVEFLKGQVSKAAISDRQRVVRELEAIAFMDIRRIVEWDEHGNVRLKPSDQIDPEAVAALKEMARREGKHGADLQVKLHEKLGALSELAKIHGLYETGTGQQTNVLILAPEKEPTVEEWLAKYGPPDARGDLLLPAPGRVEGLPRSEADHASEEENLQRRVRELEERLGDQRWARPPALPSASPALDESDDGSHPVGA